jgi:hypothetical protein
MTEYAFLVPRTTAAAARPLALQHIKEKFPNSANRDQSRQLYLFPRNYVKHARTLWSLGEFYPPNPPTPE